MRYVFLLIKNLSFPRLSSNCYQAVSWSLLKLHGAAGRELGAGSWCLLKQQAALSNSEQGAGVCWVRAAASSSFYQWVSGGILTEIDKIGKTKSRKTKSSAELLVLSAGAQCRGAFEF